MKKIVLIAQTPPPFHGQGIMQQYLVNDDWTWCEKEHIRLNYSENIKQVGRFQFSKIIKLFKVLHKIWHSGKKGRIDILYYPPAGPHRVPLYRDVVTLFFSRLFVKKIVLHFHAGGISELIDRLSSVEKFFVLKAFEKVDAAIVLSPWLKKEIEWCRPKNVFVVPNGIEDVASPYLRNTQQKSQTQNILFVGNLNEEKGIFILLDAIAQLNHTKYDCVLRVMGAAHNDNVLSRINRFIKENKLEDKVILLGSLTGEEKWIEFAKANVFCLPTYATEGMPVSIIEAMMFSLPTISTDWRAIPDIIEHGKDGLLVPPQQPTALAEALAFLISNPDNATNMGKLARQKYERLFTIDIHLKQLRKIFSDLLNIRHPKPVLENLN